MQNTLFFILTVHSTKNLPFKNKFKVIPVMSLTHLDSDILSKKCERKDGWEKRKRERIFSVLPKLIPFPISVLESLLRQILVKSG